MSPLRRLCGRFLVLAALLGPSAFAAAAPAEITPQEAQARASAGELTLVDVRTPREWRETGVARGAARIDINDPDGIDGFVKAVLQRVGGDRNAAIAVICRSGHRSGQVQRVLVAQGFTQVQSVSEGMSGSRAGPGWIERGLPVERCGEC
ncbi:MAG: rhodanese-like domain-containing protein [Aromatoleum sp.]|uniref:rhodanese-like domain-containing protein n=1 Tax=Aromatoleum sp. TaxID=2307007 RepID=UPI0028958E7E|nr:rhodanese-like domain-containing protein [Aromatoleum sp.]MDT3671980.1 rhodanese-like domain-containing protein [Aromatoleum sp.]